MKTVWGLGMPFLLSKHTEGLCECVFVNVRGHRRRELHRERVSRRRSGAGARCPVNTAGSDGGATATIRELFSHVRIKLRHTKSGCRYLCDYKVDDPHLFGCLVTVK